LTEIERSTKESEITQLKAKVEGLKKQLEWIAQKKEKLNMRSPIDGRIVTSNVEDRLLDRPVTRGETLLEVADPSKNWELELLMPEKRMGHVATARSEIKQSSGKLPVTFFLATNPSEKLQGDVEMDELSAEVRGDSGNTV